MELLVEVDDYKLRNSAREASSYEALGWPKQSRCGDIAVLVTAASVAGGVAADVRAWVYRSAAEVIALGALTLATGARTRVVWFKICPVMLVGSAILLLVASFQ